jgi:protein-S-isoprenylcysteine O-methyltransferase Ste14
VALLPALSDLAALILITLWPVIPLWWIPVHGANSLVRKIGIFIYPIVFFLWAVCAYLIYANRGLLLTFRIDFFIPVRVAGILFSCAGIFLQLWTLHVLSTRVITGVPELFDSAKTNLVKGGPFSWVRHPTYASHTLLFIGIFLATGIIATGFVALLDFIVVALVIIPMEEKELLRRFGEEYRAYMTQTPRFIPRLAKVMQLRQ